MANFTIPPLNTNPEDDLAYDSLAQTMIAEKRRKAAEVAAALAQSRQSVSADETAQADAANQKMANDYTTQLDALAPKAYEMHPQLKEYITNMRAGKDEAAANEKKQNSIYNTLDTLNNIRANEWGFKNVNIGDSGDAAQKAAVEAEKQAGAIGLKDLTGHIDMRRQVAEALARKREGGSFNPKSTGMVTKDGVPVMLSGRDENGNLLLTTPDNRRVSDDEVMPSSVYATVERNKIVTPGQTDEITALDDVIKQTNIISAQKPDQDTGTLSKLQNVMAQKVGIDDEKVSAFRALVGDNLADYIKSKTGATASNQERDFLEKNTPNFGDNDATFNTKMTNLRNKLAEMRETRMRNMENAGKDVSKFRASNPSTQVPQSLQSSQQPTSSYPKTVYNGSKKAIVQNAQEEAEANSEGFK